MSLYNNYNETLRTMFGTRVQKISINAGFTCPNRDGRVGVGGCTYCNNLTFHPQYCKPEKLPLQQLEEGMDFFKKYKGQKYMPYFQTYTNTYAPLSTLKALYTPLLKHKDVVGLVVGTRPDCVDEPMLDYFAELAKTTYVMLEYGVESTLNTTLKTINRGHSYETSEWAIRATHERGIHTGAHLILGLPGETPVDFMHHADKLSELPLDMLKLHQLQIVRGTKMYEDYKNDSSPFHLFELEDYIKVVCRFLKRLNPNIGLERFISSSPEEYLVAPDWGIKNFEFVHKLEKSLLEDNF